MVLAGHLMAAPDLAVLESTGLPAIEPFRLLEALPADVVAEAERWHPPQTRQREASPRNPLLPAPGEDPSAS
jgi:hypothetical protein